jgi:two-component system chemotaxis sensor kinase CheA
MPPVRVAAERLDALTDLAARLATAQRRLEHLLGAPEDARVLEVRDRLGHAVRALSRELVGLRLLPVSTVTPVLRGAVQRWAAATGASVRFEIEGETIRLDRTLLERVFDPLGQLLRNAVVHGAAESRPDAPTTILLSVAHDADRLRFGVADDGRGLDPAAVARRARARGLLGDAAEVGDGEALRLLAHPGLSGREGADHLSGRGLGLAAARAAAEELGGELALWSARGRGFRALLRLPARLTILDAFVVEGSGQLFALPAASVREIREAWNVPDDTRRVLVLAEALGVRGAGSAPDKALVVEGVAGPEALLVGRVLERREIVVRPLGPPLEGVPPWAGATPLAEGGLALVVDPARVAAAEREGLSAAPDRATMRA